MELILFFLKTCSILIGMLFIFTAYGFIRGKLKLDKINLTSKAIVETAFFFTCIYSWFV